MVSKRIKLAIFVIIQVFVECDTEKVHCDVTFPLLTQVAFEEKDNGGLRLQGTVARIPLTLGQTLCFSMTLNKSTKHINLLGTESKKRIFYVIRLEEVLNEYPVQNLYEFSEIHFKFSCICDCHLGIDRCNPSFANVNCSNRDSSVVCYQFYKIVSGQGCLFFTEGELCCKVWIIPNKKIRYTAVQLGVHRTKIRIRKFEINENGERIGPEVLLDTYSSEGRFTSEGTFQVELTSTMQKPHLTAGMYFVDPSGHVFQPLHVRLNEPGTYDMTRIGWLKHINGKTYPPYKSTLLSKLHVKTINCLNDNHKISHSYLTGDFKNLSAKVEELYRNEVKTVTFNKNKRRVEEVLRSIYRTDFTIHFKEPVDVMFKHQASSLKDFDAIILLDKYSNEFLNVSLIEISGTAIGWVKHENKQIEFSIIIKSEKPINTIVYKPVGVCAKHVTLCLRALFTEQTICKNISCKVEPLEGVIREDGTYENVDVLEKDPWKYRGFGYFRQLLNPLNWFKGWTGMAAMVLQVVIAFVAIVIITKIYICITSLKSRTIGRA
ncbi:cell fusion protein aff-1-like [Tachypleus tridentatus]|uniref:cell fusion protein aff-1-like n=1 Tax=Tachypleus tridentatus TaxID=6853 RepID=UPI003FD53C8C